MMRVTDFFKQRKRGVDGSSKSARAAASEQEQQQEQQVATKSDAAAAAPAPSHDEVLRQFDLASKYGPCTGMTRLERWERAQRLGLEPPAQVRAILEAAGAGSPANQNIWHARV